MCLHASQTCGETGLIADVSFHSSSICYMFHISVVLHIFVSPLFCCQSLILYILVLTQINGANFKRIEQNKMLLT